MQLIVGNDKIGFAMEEKNLSIEKAISGTLLKYLSKNGQEANLMILLSTLILKTASFFNIGKNITEDQAINTASLILEKYPYETLEDFVMVFKMAKKGELGKVYDRIDPQVIFEWCNQYFDKKAEARENIHLKQKQKYISEADKTPLTDKAKEALKHFTSQQPKEEPSENDFQRLRADYLMKKAAENQARIKQLQDEFDNENLQSREAS